MATPLLESIGELPLAFGGAAISGEGGGYGFGDISEEDAKELLLYSYEKGFRIFDTAPIYGFGLSEERIGNAFKNMREKVFIVSKSGVSWGENKRVDMTNDPKITEQMLVNSLRTLKTDYIDLYMVHWPDARVDIRRPMEVLSKAKREGKIKHIGLCNTHISDLDLAFQIDRVEVVQSEFNFFNFAKIKEELFPYLQEKNISFMSWGTLDKGILTGRVDENRKAFDKSDARSWAPWWKNADNGPKFKAMKQINELLNGHGHNGLELALTFNLSFKELSVAICGARSKSQIDGLLAAFDHKLENKLLGECEKIRSEFLK